jgi:predicted pyridoxine 5'-phosphate oxidase superfamily flavin-nucleotide-binding protein
MAKLPDAVSREWEDREGPVIFATVSKKGVPNIIYATCVSKYNEEKLVIADNFFDKTRKNILDGSKGSLLFMTKSGKAFQVKGSLEYHKDGEIFEDMKKWNPEKLTGHAAAVVKVEKVFSGAEKLL